MLKSRELLEAMKLRIPKEGYTMTLSAKQQLQYLLEILEEQQKDIERLKSIPVESD